MTSYIREQGVSLAKAGYPVIAVWSDAAESLSASDKEQRLRMYKAAVESNWQSNPMSPEKCAAYGAKFGAGVICGYGDHPIVGVDCDIAGDEELAGTIRKRLNEVLGFEGQAPIRYGRRPKFMIIGAMDPNNKHRKFVSKKYTKDLREIPESKKDCVQLEVLGTGRYFVAYGTHPTTKAPYEWESSYIGENLYDYPIDKLPVFTEEALTKCVEIFEEEVEKREGYFVLHGGSACIPASGGDDWTNVVPVSPPLGLTPKFAKAMIQDLIDAKKISLASYETWLPVGMALHHEFQGSEDGLNVWDDLSQEAPKYEGFDTVKKHWDSFGKGYKGALKTMRSYRSLWLSLPKNDKYACNEAGLMHRIVLDFGDRLRYVPETELFRECKVENNRWFDSYETKVRSCIQNLIETGLVKEADDIEAEGMEDRAKDIRTFRAKCRATLNRVCSNVQKDIQAQVTAHLDEFDADKDIFAVGNGVVSLTTLEFSETKPEHMVSRGTHVNYDSTADGALWRKTLKEIFLGDEAVMKYFQKAVGYALLGNPKEEVFFLLVGSGANGKSLVLEVLESVFGAYGTSLSAKYFTQKNDSNTDSPSGADPVLLDLVGKRFVVSSETERGARVKEATLKGLVSHDTLSARALYSNKVVKFKPTWVIFVATNTAPHIGDTTDGTWRRLRRIDFNAKFRDDDPRTDKDLERKLSVPREQSGVLNWCIEGCQLYREEGLATPDSVKEAVTEMRKDSDVLASWLEECCVKEEGAKTEPSILLESWKAFVAQMDLVSPFKSEKAFFMALGDKFPKRRTGTARHYSGIRLKTAEEDLAKSYF